MLTIKQTRAALGLTQKDFATKLDLTIRQLSRLETGDSPLSTIHILALECLLRRAGLFGEEQKPLFNDQVDLLPDYPGWNACRLSHLIEDSTFKPLTYYNFVNHTPIIVRFPIAKTLLNKTGYHFELWDQRKIQEVERIARTGTDDFDIDFGQHEFIDNLMSCWESERI